MQGVKTVINPAALNGVLPEATPKLLEYDAKQNVFVPLIVKVPPPFYPEGKDTFWVGLYIDGYVRLTHFHIDFPILTLYHIRKIIIYHLHGLIH